MKRFSVQEAGFSPKEGLAILLSLFTQCPLCRGNAGYTHLKMWIFKCNTCGIIGALNDIGPTHQFVFSVDGTERKQRLGLGDI